MPAAAVQIEALLKIAIELHPVLWHMHKTDRRWLTPLLFGLLGIVLGGVLQAALK